MRQSKWIPIPWIPSLVGVLASVCLSLGSAACVATDKLHVVESPTLLRQGDSHFRSANYDQALASYLLAVKAAIEERDESNEIASLAQVALVYALQEDPARARASLQRAAEVATFRDPPSWTRVLLARGALERLEKRDEAALATYDELYEYATVHQELERAAQAAHMATLIAEGDERVRWARRGIDTAEASGRSSWKASAWLALAWIQEDLGRSEEALKAFTTAKSFAERTSNDDAVMQADWALAHGKRMAGDRKGARELAQRTLARAKTAYALSAGDEQSGYPQYAIWVAQCQRELAELDVEEQDLEAALDRFVEAQRFFVLAGLRELAPSSLALLEGRVEEVRQQLASKGSD